MALDKQVHIYSVDTSAFYYNDEKEIHKKINKMYILKYKIKKLRKKTDKLYNKNNLKYKSKKDLVDNMYKRINKLIQKYKNKIYKLFEKNKGGVRTLDKDYLIDKNVVSIFDSELTRTIGIKTNELSNEIIIVQAYFFEVLEDIILNGFISNNEKYIVYTASAGQIRKKKTVFIKEKTLKRIENTLTCGLIDKTINGRGTININKYLAYRALQNSATEVWKDFDIDKAIVVDDFETNVKAIVDYIDDKTYEIKRTEMEVPIPHMDGAGIMLSSFCNKNRMCRSPWVKGLLIPSEFKEFVLEKCEETHKNYAIVKDIYGKEYDIIADDIQVIFTKSQFKLHKFYKDWQEYKDNFKKYNCQVGYCNEEEDEIKDSRINYQMLQTLSDMSDEELKQISTRTMNDIYKISNDKDTMQQLLGAVKNNSHKNYLQQAIQYYPQLLNDTYSKEILKQTRKSLVKKAKSGKLFLKAKYTFLCPDLYAFCEWLFLGIKNPNGLLKKDEVSCNLYNDNKELDCLRSPHLYQEHCVRINRVEEKQKKWFVTKGIYTSCKDIISKVLMFDNDGDKSLVCADKTIVDVAKRNIKNNDIVPLYYNMKKAGCMKVNKQTIYKGLISAYKGGNIGAISNNITKIWNSKNIDLDTIKLLCLENNFTIDYAKTLYKPVRPKWAKEKISKYTKAKVPYFFIYAKDKTKNNVEKINNSVVNRLNKIIKTPTIKIKSINGKFNYKKLMNNSDIKINNIDKKIIDKYNELDLKNVYLIDKNNKKCKDNNLTYKYQQIRKKILEINNNKEYVTDILIKYLYCDKKINKKVTLWECFGDVIVNNLKNNLTKGFKNEAIECENCGILIENTNGKKKYCDECAKKIKLENDRKIQKKRYYDKILANRKL